MEPKGWPMNAKSKCESFRLNRGGMGSTGAFFRQSLIGWREIPFVRRRNWWLQNGSSRGVGERTGRAWDIRTWRVCDGCRGYRGESTALQMDLPKYVIPPHR